MNNTNGKDKESEHNNQNMSAEQHGINIHGNGNFNIPHQMWDMIIEKEARIKELEERLRHKEHVIRHLLHERMFLVVEIVKQGCHLPKFIHELFNSLHDQHSKSHQ